MEQAPLAIAVAEGVPWTKPTITLTLEPSLDIREKPRMQIAREGSLNEYLTIKMLARALNQVIDEIDAKAAHMENAAAMAQVQAVMSGNGNGR